MFFNLQKKVKWMSQARLESLRIGPEKNFCYAIVCPETSDAALIDPAFEFDRVLTWLKSLSTKPVKLKYLIATHGHWDHAGGFPDMLERVPDAKVVAAEGEASRLKKAGIDLDVPLKDGQELKVGNVIVRALNTPGHTEGGCCYLVENQIFTGDTLFVGQCGRTDLEGGSDELLFASLQKLKSLPGTLIVRPGHDYGSTPTSTIANEIRSNPTMAARTLREFIALP
jgi:hydroxyacylglutathione hydrolase